LGHISCLGKRWGGDSYFFVSTKCLSESLNQGPIKLIPKNTVMDSIGGWWPITLLRIGYKIIAKDLAKRVRDVARKIVCREKTSFVQGQFILDTFLSSWVAMEWAKEFGQHALFQKNDFDKAYDDIDWTFIPDMLTFQLGFGQLLSVYLSHFLHVPLLLFQGIMYCTPTSISIDILV